MLSASFEPAAEKSPQQQKFARPGSGFAFARGGSTLLVTGILFERLVVMKQSKKSIAKDFRRIHSGWNPENLPSVWRVFPKLSQARIEDKEKAIRKFALWASQVQMNLGLTELKNRVQAPVESQENNPDSLSATFHNIPEHVLRALQWFKKTHGFNDAQDGSLLLLLAHIAMTLPSQLSPALNNILRYRDSEGLDLPQAIKSRIIDRPEYRKVKMSK